MMDRKEALEFLELPDLATPQEIKAKLASKLTYFETLSEKAPSNFVRRLHQRNVERVKEIMQQTKSWEGMGEPEAVAPVVEQPVAAEAVAVEPAAVEPVAAKPVEPAKPAALKQEAPLPVAAKVEVPKAEAPKAEAPKAEAPKAEAPKAEAPKTEAPKTEAPKVEAPKTEAPKAEAPKVDALKAVKTVVTTAQQSPKPVGWLIRHTENQSTTSYPIYGGKTFIGRKEKPGLQPFVRIGDDPYISKFHAVILAEPGYPTTFYLADDAAAKGEKSSTNGTYLNGGESRVTAKTPVKNNDTIQIGITKLVFRINDADVQTIVKEVAKKNYMHTVIIDVK